MGLSEILLIASGLMAMLLAVGQALRPGRNPGRLIFAGLFFSGGSWFLYAGLLYSGIIKTSPHLLMTHLPMSYAMAPLFYLYIRHAIRGAHDFDRRTLLHFLPMLLVLIWMIPIYFAGVEYKSCLYYKTLAGTILSAETSCSGKSAFLPLVYERVSYLVIIGNKISLFIYTLALIKALLPLRRHETPGVPRIRILTLALIFHPFISVLIGLMGIFYPILFRIAILMGAFFVCLVYFAGQRFPEYLADSMLKKPKSDPAVYGLDGVEVRRLENEVKELMEEEKVYLQEGLSLIQLASLLDLRPDQLSAVINIRFNKNYNQFVNGYRIDEACKLLREENNSTILDIALDVGFANKATFNRAFRDKIGQTPKEYRKAHHK